MSKKIKLLELFGGIGAPRKALENLGFDIKSIDYVEILSNAVKAYNAMYDLSYKEQDVLNWNMDVDLLVQGSPYQDFSGAGLNDLSTGRSILYNRTLEIIEKQLNPRPKVVIWENVEGLLKPRHKKHYDHYINKMNELGYRSYGSLLNPIEFGIPQYRSRIFTISIRNDINKVFDFNNLVKKELKPIIDFLEENISSKYDVTQPSMLKALENKKERITLTNHSTVTTKVCRWNSSVFLKDYSIYKDIAKENTLPPSKSKYGYNLDEFQSLFGIYDMNIFRYPTPLECWRLQGFDDETFYRVKNIGLSDNALYHLAGNSICVPVLEAIFSELHKLEII